MEMKEYWTGIADVASDTLPANIKGALYRVVTFAEDREAFTAKVQRVLLEAGDRLLYIEETETVDSFLKQSWVDNDHEIFELIETAKRQKANVVCGDAEFYSFDDS